MIRKMLNFKMILISLMVILISVSLSQSTFASTCVYLDFDSPYSIDNGIGGIQFSILGPDTATADNFSANFPDSWFDFSTGLTISAFDSDVDGNYSLSNGEIGYFDVDVTLGNWELTLQDGTVLTTIDYTVLVSGSDYILTDTPAAVPIPSAIILLGGGLFGMLGIRRKIK
jgi:hypothetical protein